MNEEKCKLTIRNLGDKKALQARINRIEGQIRGIKQMIDNDVYCDDILVQVSAAAQSLKSMGRQILNGHLKSCVKRELLAGNDEIIDEVMNSFSKLQ